MEALVRPAVSQLGAERVLKVLTVAGGLRRMLVVENPPDHLASDDLGPQP
jgi:hypothetical protein